MNVEKQYLTSSSRTIYPRQGQVILNFVDKRSEAMAQAKLIGGIQNNDKKEFFNQQKRDNKTELPNDWGTGTKLLPHPPVFQMYKSKDYIGGYQRITNMNLLDLKEAKINKEQKIGRFRAESIDEYNDPNISDAIDIQLNNREAAENARIGHDLELKRYLDQYLKLYEYCMMFKSNLKKYEGLIIGQKRIVDAPLLVQGIRNYRSLAGQVDFLRQNLIENIRPQINMMVNNGNLFNIENQLDEMEESILDKVVIFNTTPSGCDHSSSFFMDTVQPIVAYNPHDITNNAVFTELVILNNINQNLAYGDDFGPVLRNIIDHGFVNINISDASFAEPNQVARAPLVGLSHTTLVGTGGYRGRSVWGKINDANKLEIVALAQHGNTNKKYVKVAGAANVPGNWRLNN